MRILAWNILHGGGARRTPEIALAILDHHPDLVVLTEFRRSMGGQLAGVLSDHGLPHQLDSNPPPRTNGLLIASNTPIQPTPDADLFASRPDLARRWLDVLAPELDLRITGVHIPDAIRSDPHALARKSLYWRRLLSTTASPESARRVIVGDFNTGRHRLDESGSTFTCTALLGELTTRGYADAYRQHDASGRDISWESSTGAGFRLDHAYVSPPLHNAAPRVSYSQSERKKGLSDHAPMLIELDLEGAKLPG